LWCIYKKNFLGYNKNKGADILEIYNNEKNNYISVWMTKEEQQLFDRQELTDLLLSNVKNKKCKVIYFYRAAVICTAIRKFCLQEI